jgi:hypothetical protein
MPAFPIGCHPMTSQHRSCRLHDGISTSVPAERTARSRCRWHGCLPDDSKFSRAEAPARKAPARRSQSAALNRFSIRAPREVQGSRRTAAAKPRRDVGVSSDPRTCRSFLNVLGAGELVESGTLRQTYVTQHLRTAANSCGKVRNPALVAGDPTSSAQPSASDRTPARFHLRN